METTFIYILLSLVMGLPITQALISANYFRPFVLQYIDNTRSSWNPSNDRRMFVFTFTFTFISLFLAREIYSGKTEHSWLITLLYFLTIIILFFLTITVIKLQRKENLKKSIDLQEKENRSTNKTTPKTIIEHESINEKISKVVIGFKRYEILNNTKYEEFLDGNMQVNLTNGDFYIFHKLFVEKIGIKISLKEFCTKFRNSKNAQFNYEVVRKEGTQSPNSKRKEILEEIFSNI